jgi:hypothetical protein
MDAAPPTNDARSVLEELRGRGVVLWNEAERLRFRAPEGVMTADVVDRLRTHKSQIMRLLEAERAGVTPPVLRSRPRPESVPIIRYHYDRWADMVGNRSGPRFACGPHLVVRVGGPLDIEVLTQSLRLLARRQSILRARVVDRGGGPCFAYETSEAIVPTFVDLSVMPGITEERVRQVASELVWRPFDLAADAWFRAFVIRLAAADHLFGFVIHHFIADIYSVTIAAHELFAIYSAQVLGRTAALPSLPIQYHDYVLAVNEWLDTDNVRVLEAFWRERLRVAPTMRIPPDVEVGPDTLGREKIVWFDLPDALTEKLRVVTNCNPVSIHVHLAAALSATLAHVNGSTDILTFHRVSGRSVPALRDLIGAFFDSMALRVAIDREGSFAQCVERTRQSFYESYAGSLYPFAMLKRLLPQVGASGIAPLVNFNDTYGERELSGLEVRGTTGPLLSLGKFALSSHPVEVRLARDHPGFYLEIQHTARGINGRLDYFESQYFPETIERFIDVFARLLESGLAHPGVPMQALLAKCSTDSPKAGKHRFIS